MNNRLSEQSKELISSLWQFKATLNQIIPKDLAEYIVTLIAKDQAHQKLLELTKED
jgi:hypothetical protein